MMAKLFGPENKNLNLHNMFLNLRHLFQFCECKCAHLNYNVSIFYYHHTESTDSSGKKQTISTTKVIFLYFLTRCSTSFITTCSWMFFLYCKSQTKPDIFIVVFERLSITLHIYQLVPYAYVVFELTSGSFHIQSVLIGASP